VIPFGPNFIVTDINVGLLLFLAMSSLGVDSITLAGWSSNNKYALLGGHPLLVADDLLRAGDGDCARRRAHGGRLAGLTARADGRSDPRAVRAAGWCVYPASRVRCSSSTALAETNRTPFDLPEAEAELVAGLRVFEHEVRPVLPGEFANVITICSIAVTLFLGGWNGPWLPDSLKFLWFFAKLGVLLFFFIWVRWTYPRLRYDQLMHFGWKVLLPAALANIVITSVWAYWSAHR
jgi:NADH-quinone oxidoreductase subunit H